jgi:hypothetical protein
MVDNIRLEDPRRKDSKGRSGFSSLLLLSQPHFNSTSERPPGPHALKPPNTSYELHYGVETGG